jgi:hypothetical protein
VAHALIRNTFATIVVLALGVTGLAGCLHPRSTPSPAPASRSVAFVVEVVDANGAPLADVSVEGLADVNPGPVASTCCMEKRFAYGKTSEKGVVALWGAPLTFRAFHFLASYRDWPPRKVTVTTQLGLPNVVRVALGPTREVRGRVDLGPDCALSPGLEVYASAPDARAQIAADGSFYLESVAPWASIWVYACGRGARVDLEVGHTGPVVVALPQVEEP